MDKFTFSSAGEIQKVEFALARAEATHAEIEEMTKGSFFADVLAVVRGSGKIVRELLLEPVGAATIPATDEAIVLSQDVLSERYNIGWYGDNFKEWFFGKKTTPFGGSILAYKKLVRRSVDGPIITELGGQIAARTAPVEMLRLVEAQKNGGSGPLLTDGYANIFYWEDQICSPEDEQVAYTNEAGEKVVLRAVFVDWSGDYGYWSADALTMTNPLEWSDGYQVFSRNSR